MKKATMISICALALALGGGCDRRPLCQATNVQGKVIRHSYDGKPIFGVNIPGLKRDITVGGKKYLLKVDVEGKEYKITVGNSKVKDLGLLSQEIRTGSTVGFPLDYCAEEKGSPRQYFTEDGFGYLRSHQITLLPKK